MKWLSLLKNNDKRAGKYFEKEVLDGRFELGISTFYMSSAKILQIMLVIVAGYDYLARWIEEEEERKSAT